MDTFPVITLWMTNSSGRILINLGVEECWMQVHWWPSHFIHLGIQTIAWWMNFQWEPYPTDMFGIEICHRCNIMPDRKSHGNTQRVGVTLRLPQSNRPDDKMNARKQACIPFVSARALDNWRLHPNLGRMPGFRPRPSTENQIRHAVLPESSQDIVSRQCCLAHSQTANIQACSKHHRRSWQCMYVLKTRR